MPGLDKRQAWAQGQGLASEAAQASAGMAAAGLSVECRPGGAAVVTLAREPANVMNLGFWQGLTSILDELEADSSVHGVIFTSGLKRDIFTAGNDLKELYAPATSREAYNRFMLTQNLFLARLYGTRLATVASIRGACPAGGCCLALACDYRLQSEKGTFGLNETALGVPVPPFWAQLMTRIIGQGKADLLLCTAALLPPSQALQLGLLDEVVPTADLPAAAALKRFLRVDQPARAATKLQQRREFSLAWQDDAPRQAAEDWKLIESPSTVQMLKKVMDGLAKGPPKPKL